MLEGLPPNNAACVMRLKCDETSARQIADLMVETFDPAEIAASAFEETPAAIASPTDWLVEVYFQDEPDEQVVRDLIEIASGSETAAAAQFVRLEEKDWIASSLAGLQPVRAGRFLVHGGHDRAKVPANLIGLEIEAALAFGTGHHGTTRGCLLLLDGVLKRRRPEAILDVGTGTGVLAMAAAKYLRAPVACGDLDPVAVEAARNNAKLNGVAPYVRPVHARGTAHPALHKPDAYDLIFANILAGPLRMMAPSLAQVAAPGADLILSGLIERDGPGVLSAYRSQGFFLVERLVLEGWMSLRLRNLGRRSLPPV